ncbi:MAG TPA: transcription termination/antitermination protein NusG [Nitrospiria bacterium]
MGKSWYVIHTYSGFEGRVKATIEEQANSKGLTEKFGRVLVPTEEVIEIKEGKKRTSTKKYFPGYVLVEMVLDDETSQLVKGTPKVTGFLGGESKPAPLSQPEVDRLLKQMDEGLAAPKEKLHFQKGDAVRIIDGPFLGFNGSVDEVHADQNKVKVLVSIFGRSTPVELGFLQVERL